MSMIGDDEASSEFGVIDKYSKGDAQLNLCTLHTLSECLTLSVAAMGHTSVGYLSNEADEEKAGKGKRNFRNETFVGSVPRSEVYISPNSGRANTLITMQSSPTPSGLGTSIGHSLGLIYITH